MKKIQILLVISLFLIVCCSPRDEQVIKNSQLVREWLELYNQGKDKEASDIYSDSVIFHPALTPDKPVIGRETMLQSSLEFRKTEPNYKCIVKETIAEKDRVVMKWEVEMSSGIVEVIGLYRIKDGKITELEEYYSGDGYRLLSGEELNETPE